MAKSRATSTTSSRASTTWPVHRDRRRGAPARPSRERSSRVCRGYCDAQENPVEFGGRTTMVMPVPAQREGQRFASECHRSLVELFQPDFFTKLDACKDAKEVVDLVHAKERVCNGPQVSRSGVLPRWHGLFDDAQDRECDQVIKDNLPSRPSTATRLHHRSFRGDLVITMIDLTEELSQDPRSLRDWHPGASVDKNRDREKLHAWLDEHKGEEPG